MTRWNDGSDQTATVSPDITDETNALPVRYFTDSDVWEDEKEDVFSRYWVYAGNAKNVPEEGDYFTREIAGKDIVVTRNGDGDINAFYNVCAHRGCKAVDDVDESESQNTPAFTCPYHTWTYDLDGKLVNTPDSFEDPSMNPDVDAEDVDGPDAEKNSLKSVSVETMGPLIFVNFADDPMPLEEMSGSMMEEIEDLDLEQYEHVKRVATEIDCNWKVLGGNYSECDHCQANHQEWIRDISLDDSELDVREYHWVLHYAYADHVDALEDEALFYYLWPNFTLNVYGTAEGYATYIIKPVDEETTVLIADYFFEDDELTDERQEMIETSVQLQEEDIELVERQQEGLETGALAQGELGPNEHTVHRLHQLAQEAYGAD